MPGSSSQSFFNQTRTTQAPQAIGVMGTPLSTNMIANGGFKHEAPAQMQNSPMMYQLQQALAVAAGVAPPPHLSLKQASAQVPAYQQYLSANARGFANCSSCQQ